MEKLFEFYKKSINALLLGIVGIGSFMSFLQEKLVFTDVILNQLFKLLFPSIIIASTFYFGELFIRKVLWRSRFFYRNSDFSGTWIGWTRYTDLEVPSNPELKKVFKEFNTLYKAKIVQDCVTIKVEDSGGDEFLNWSTLIATVTNNNRLAWVYDVTYTLNRDLLGENSNGFTELTTKVRDPKDKKLPIILGGAFRQCVGGQPRYRGVAVFVKENYLNSIVRDMLPKYAREFSLEILGHSK